MASGTITHIFDLGNLGTLIPTNTDMNTITTPGRYYCSNISGVTNSPTFQAGASFDLYVVPRASLSRIWQIMFVYNGISSQEMWIRAMTGASSFGDWTKCSN